MVGLLNVVQYRNSNFIGSVLCYTHPRTPTHTYIHTHIFLRSGSSELQGVGRPARPPRVLHTRGEEEEAIGSFLAQCRVPTEERDPQ